MFSFFINQAVSIAEKNHIFRLNAVQRRNGERFFDSKLAEAVKIAVCGKQNFNLGAVFNILLYHAAVKIYFIILVRSEKHNLFAAEKRTAIRFLIIISSVLRNQNSRGKSLACAKQRGNQCRNKEKHR